MSAALEIPGDLEKSVDKKRRPRGDVFVCLKHNISQTTKKYIVFQDALSKKLFQPKKNVLKVSTLITT